jgi:signal transduction histidine kinase
MDKLLKGLLRITRIGRESFEAEEIDMDKLMGYVADSFRFIIKEKDIHLDIGSLPTCYGNSFQISQVFSNLIENAIKYSRSEHPRNISIRGYKEKSMAIYCVEDNGIGISPDHQANIFEIFHQLDPSSPGDGLGLTLIKRIVSRHDGDIWVESEENKGTLFFVRLPTEPNKMELI